MRTSEDHELRLKSRLASKKRILAAATKIFRENGYSGLTIDDLSDSINISKASIYYHWSGKQELLYEITRNAHLKILNSLKKLVKEGDPIEIKLQRAIRNHITVVSSEIPLGIVTPHQDFGISAKHREAIIGLRDKIEGIFRQIIADAMHAGVIRKTDVKLATFFVIGAANYTALWYDPRGPVSLDEIIVHIIDYIDHGLLAEKAREQTT
jgi:AcrR family transcriptional regulator